MKIQYIAVIFIVIIMPIAMVMQSYIQSQMDTIQLQLSYDNSLTNATYDAIKAFQINTVNNRYSSISNSKIRDIEASVNTFYNSLINSQNLSRESLQDYTPALVFTLYDGYYIYSKYDNVYPENNGQPITTDINMAQDNWGLKPYIYYSCRYRNGTKDFIINYTLDNAITIYGTFNGTYQTLSGYLIDPNAVSISRYYNVNNPQTWSLNYDGVAIEPEILTEHLLFNNGEEGDYEYLEYNGQKIYYDKYADIEDNNGTTRYFRYQDYTKTYITDSYINSSLTEYLRARTWNRNAEPCLHSTSSFEYYYDAMAFSSQVAELTRGIKQIHAVDENGQPIEFNINTTDDIFVASDTNDPLISGSTFNENRVAVIRKSIETNLTAAIANYNSYSGLSLEFELPVLSDVDWDKATNNISMITFLQGIPIGHKYYNNYCVITNDSNEEVINNDNIYIVTENASGQREYHMPGCHELMSNTNLTIVEAYSNLSFIRQTVRISEGNYWYFYPQMRTNGNSITTITGCYHCIVSSASLYSIDEIVRGTIMIKDDNWNDIVGFDINLSGQANRRFATIRAYYLTALGRERHDLYQANMDAF